MKQKLSHKIIINILLILLCLTFIIPFIYVISLSLTSEDVIRSAGYRLLPKQFDFAAYEWIFNNPHQLITSYKVTIEFSAVGTISSMIVMTMIAYALSRKQFYYRRVVTFFVYFTMLFSGGLIPSYIINSKYLHLSNNFWIYVLPSLAGAYYILVLRTFFCGIPDSLVESAKIDGASEMTIFRIIMLPLSKPVLATVSLFVLLDKWNNWQTSLIYIMNSDLFSLQYLLQKILRESEFLQKMSEEASLIMKENYSKTNPLESLRFAMAILAAGPMLVVFPFFQKYFTRGLTIGAVKG